MKTVIITEKPSVASEYANVLGISARHDGYISGFSSVINKDLIITWAVGHLIELGRPEEQAECRILPDNVKDPWSFNKLPILPKNWFYKPQTSTEPQLEIIRSIYTSPEIAEIYYAGDSGREGIYIQALIRNHIFGNKDPKNITERVVWIDSFTEEEILRGIREAKPYHSYDNMIAAGYLRAKTDYLIGMNFTQGATLKFSQGKGTLNQGRVMTVVDAMVVKRDEEIDNFVSTSFYGVKASLNDHAPVWKVDDKSYFKDSSLLYNETGFKLKTNAEKLIVQFNKSLSLLVEDINVTEKKEYAPQLFNLGSLQAECSKLFHLRPKQTLEIAQELYEGKYTTYPRTEACVLSSAVAKDLRNKGYRIPDSTKYVDDSKIVDHYAIIPTFERNPMLAEESLKGKVYNLILNRFMAITMDPYVYDSVKAIYKHSNGEHFYEDGKNDKSLGWKSLYTDELNHIRALPNKGDTVVVNSFDLTEGQTKAPAPYTTGTLITAMEKAGKLIDNEELANQIKSCGIGTPATRADIIEKLSTIGYISIDNKQKVHATETGKYIYKVMSELDPVLVSPEKTAELEKNLSDVADGTCNADVLLTTVENYVTGIVNKLRETPEVGLYTCPYCGGALISGPFGFWCKTSKDFNSFGGHKLSENDVIDLLGKGITKVYTLKNKDGKSYKAAIRKGSTKNELSFDTK